jgi:GNAT superfamily N-acetyltransferase
MQIRRLNPADDERDLAAVTPAFLGWGRDFLPGFPDCGEARIRFWCSTGYRQQTTVLGAFADERATEADGVAMYNVALDKNPDLASVDLIVPAEACGRGVDAALFDEARRMTAVLGRKRLWLETPESTDPGAFAERQGDAKHTETTISSALDLNAIDQDQFEAWAAPSAKNGEYTLVRWIDRCPDEFAESYTRAQDAMHDQPKGVAPYEFARNDVDRLRFAEGQALGFGLRKYRQVALDPDGNVAGFHVLVAHPGEPADVDIWDTGVVRAHRGHGLGLRLKAAAGLWLLEERPETRWVRTFNNDENRWMLAVNRAMGYRPTGDWLNYEYAVS